MTEVPALFVQLLVEINGHEEIGISSDCLPPKWFTKIPERPLTEEVDEMLAVIGNASSLAVGLKGSSAFEIWWEIYQAQASWAKARGIPPLLAHFGTSLIERALLETICKASGKTFAQGLHENLFGIRLGVIHPALQGIDVSALLPATPLRRIVVRHTVGLGDPLLDEDIPPREHLDDGLPQSLSACNRTYGLRHFKIKVNGDLERDLDRLRRVARVIQQNATDEFAFSLDGNEQFKSTEQFQEFWKAISNVRELREFFQHLLFVEQPFHRDFALQPKIGLFLKRWPDGPPVIIDESDARPEDLRQALSLGYSGTSHKNCKGIFKGIAHRCLLAHLQRESDGKRVLMSGEDLCNIGPVALLQDLAVMAALGIQSVERNGHHYHAGLSQFPQTVQAQILSHHSDLYNASTKGWPTLRIVEGEIGLDSVNNAAFGVGFLLNTEAFEHVAA